MKLLILGRDGQVGWELQRALVPLGEVVALSRAQADLEYPEALIGAVAAECPDMLVNAAAYTAVDKAESEPGRADRINRAGVEALAGWAAASNCWLVHYSTDYVFDGRKTSPYVETDETAPQGAYGRSKRAGEDAVLASGCRHLIFRTSWVHSARGANFVRTILRLASQQEQLRVVADQCGAPTGAELVADVTAMAIAAVARRDDPLASGVYHLAAAGRTTWHEFARFIVAEAIERGAVLRATADAIVPIATSEYRTAAKRPANSLLDTGKLKAALRIELPDWTIGARRSIAELVENGAA
jgi:dTDP-4-dehydrorhamnose reductase